MKVPSRIAATVAITAMVAVGCSRSTEELRGAAANAAIEGPADGVTLYFDPDTQGDIDATVDLLGTRLTSFGYDGVQIEVEGDSGVVVVRAEQRGGYDLSVVAPYLAAPGRLEFRPVLRALLAADTSTGGLVDNVTESLTDPDEVRAEEVVVLAQRDGIGDEIVRYELGPAALGGESVESARAGGSPENYLVSVDLADAEAVDALNAVAEQCRTRSPDCPTGQLGIVVDDRVLSVPGVGSSSFNQNDVAISGLWTLGEASALAAILNTAPSEDGVNLVRLTLLAED